MSSHTCTALHADWRIPRTFLESPHTQPSSQSGGSQGYPRILPRCPPHPALQAVWGIPRASQDPPWMSPAPSPTGSLGDSKGIPGSSLEVPHTQPSRQSGVSQEHPRILPGCPPHPALQAVWGSQGHPRILPGCPSTPSPPGSLEDPKGIPGSFLDVPPHTALQAVLRIPRTCQDPP